MMAQLCRPVRMTSRKPTDECSFSYKPESAALYDLIREKPVEFVAGNVRGPTGCTLTLWRAGASPSPHWSDLKVRR
ncbi:hypothetical protein EMIT0P294_60224 [Pseudomonas sp. IT-P294]